MAHSHAPGLMCCLIPPSMVSVCPLSTAEEVQPKGGSCTDNPLSSLPIRQSHQGPEGHQPRLVFVNRARRVITRHFVAQYIGLMKVATCRC